MGYRGDKMAYEHGPCRTIYSGPFQFCFRYVLNAVAHACERLTILYDHSKHHFWFLASLENVKLSISANTTTLVRFCFIRCHAQFHNSYHRKAKQIIDIRTRTSISLRFDLLYFRTWIKYFEGKILQFEFLVEF